MAIVFMDGFDHYTNTQEERKWDEESAASISTTNPRTGNRALEFNVVGAFLRKNLTPSLGKLLVGYAMFLDDVLTADTYNSCIIFRSGTSDQLLLQYSQIDQKFRFRNQLGAVSAVSVNTYDISTGYHHVEMKITFDNAVDADNTVELRVNGITEIGGSLGTETMDTDPQNTDICDGIELSGLNGLLRIDDFVLLNTVAPNNDFLGDVKIVTLFVDADGAVLDWTPSAPPSWQQVDDTDPDDNATNIVSSTNGQQSLFSMDTLSGVGTIKGIQISAAARKDGAGDGDIKLLTRDSGGDINKSDTLTVGAQASKHPYHTQQQDVDPKTGSAWTVANINAAQFGVEQIS